MPQACKNVMDNTILFGIKKDLIDSSCNVERYIFHTIFSITFKNIYLSEQILLENRTQINSLDLIKKKCTTLLSRQDLPDTINKEVQSSLSFLALFQTIYHNCSKITAYTPQINHHHIIPFSTHMQLLAETLSLMLKCLVDAYVLQNQQIADTTTEIYTKQNIALNTIPLNATILGLFYDIIKKICDYTI